VSARIILLLAALAGCGVIAQGPYTREVLRAPIQDRQDYVHALKIRAHQLHLAQATQWLRLGHWRRTWSGDYESQADGGNFFLSPNGKDSPTLELDATLEGFFSELPAGDPRLASKNVQHPICQFPARFQWLSEQLAIDPSKLPAHDCSRYEEFVKSLQADSVTLVFSSYYLNNPASAFGHTFLRIGKKDALIPEERRQLLDYGIDYSAEVDTNFAPVYAIKGLAGAFPGTFRKVPFYFKVREYNDFESRDLWEYKLRLTPKQRDFLVAHVWELGSTFFDYFYLSENCSYHILGLIEVADPTVDLLDHVHWPTIPADAVKALYDNPGLVESVQYRPSSRTRFRHDIRDLPGDEKDAIEALADDPASKLSFAQKQDIEVLDAAQDLVDIRYAKQLVQDSRDSDGARIKQKLLERRAEILVPSAAVTEAVPWSKMPQAGHGSRRIALGGGADLQSDRWAAFGARLALHDLADPSDGYPELSQLEFLPTRARYDVTNRKFHLDEMDLVHIISLTSQDRFDRHVSWEARLGSQRLDDAGCHCYAFHTQIGGGGALATAGERATLFVLGETHLWSGPGLDGIGGASIRVGIGPAGGLRLRITPELVSLSMGEWDWLPGQTGYSTWYASETLRWEIIHDLALDLEARAERGHQSGVLSTMLYF
jgi:hypothetical protein